MASIEEAIAAAKNAAQHVIPAATTGRKLTMDDLGGGSLDVSSWLQVTEFGLRIDKSQETIEELTVEIDMSEVVPVYMIRFGKNPANYRKTYDGVTTFGSPKPWEVTLREAQSVDSDCRGQYSAVEIPMELLEDVQLKKDKKTIDAGTRIGYTTSTTGYRAFQKFWNECEKRGLASDTVKVKIGFDVKKSNGNTWGIATFTLVD